jgi:hypothetical protein
VAKISSSFFSFVLLFSFFRTSLFVNGNVFLCALRAFAVKKNLEEWDNLVDCLEKGQV